MERQSFDAAALRRQFDLAFAAAPADAAETAAELLALRAGTTRCALALEDVAALSAELAPTPLPSRAAAFLGLTLHRGALVPVFDLATLLGDSTGTAARFFVLLRSVEPVALAATHYEGLIRVPRDRLERACGPGAIVTGIIEHDGAARSVLDARALVSAIEGLGGTPTGEESSR